MDLGYAGRDRVRRPREHAAINPIREEVGVIIDCAHYRNGERQQAGPMEIEEAAELARRQDQDGFIWIGLFEPSEEELGAVQGQFGLSELAVEDAQSFHLRPKMEQYDDGAVLFAVLRTAAYTVLDGIGVRRSGTALGYTGWLFVAEGLVVPIVWWVRRGGMAAGRRLPPTLVVRDAGAGVLSVIAYGLVLWAQTRGALAVVAALRETSVVFGALIGAAMFHERMPSRRVLASALIAGGAVILAAG
jgi:Mg2+ and Co2+ transporter CorA